MSEDPKTVYIPLQPPAAGSAATPVSWRCAIAAAVLALGSAAYILHWQNLIGPREQAATGVLCFLGIVAAVSANLRAVNWRTIGLGFALQILLAVFVIKGPGYAFFDAIGFIVKKFLEFTSAGSQFVFGNLANPEAMNKLFPPNKRHGVALHPVPDEAFPSRTGGAGNPWRGAGRGRAAARQCDRRRRFRSLRRHALGAEYRRHADRFFGLHRAVQRPPQGDPR